MKIGLPLDINNAAHDAAAQRPAKASVPVDTLQSADRVNLSAAASQLGKAPAHSDFDSKKVDTIKEAIRTGQFRVNSEVISDRLIAEASALLSPRTH